MARHIWLVKRYGTGTLADAALATGVAVKGRLMEAAAVCRFVGYHVEVVRQNRRTRPEITWAGAVRSNHRYARGRNADNYLLAGRQMLSKMDPATELAPGVPVGMILDKLTEELG